MKLKLMIAAAATALAAEAATAQVFVIGKGLGGECYQKTKNRFSNNFRAEEVCTRALTEQAMTRGNRAATHTNRGILRMRNGDYEDALADFNKAIEFNPDLGAAYLNQGAAHIYRRDFSTALISLDEAIARDSADLHAAHYNRAIAREHTGDIPGAYEDFLTALELKPGWELAEAQLTRFKVEDVS